MVRGRAARIGRCRSGDLTNVLAFHTLSKRSSMTGYRSGFVAGDPELIAALRKLRPSTGLTPQEFVQRASVAAWNDEAHVEEMRANVARKRKLFLDVLTSHGVRVAGPGDVLPLGRRAGRAHVARLVAPPPRRGRRDRRPRFVLRRRRRGLRPTGDGADARRLRAGGRVARPRARERRVSATELAERIERSWDEPDRLDAAAVEEAIGAARPRRGPRGRAGRGRLARERLGEEGRPALLPGPRPRRRPRSGRSSTTTGCR